MTAAVPWMETEPVEGTDMVRVAWITHSDGFRAGGRVGSHRGECQRDGRHMLLWHLCSGRVWLREGGTEEWLDFPRWTVTLGAEVNGRKCCGMLVRVRDVSGRLTLEEGEVARRV